MATPLLAPIAKNQLAPLSGGGPIGLLDLPNELLDRIATEAVWDLDSDKLGFFDALTSGGATALLNLRLTCRRLANCKAPKAPEVVISIALCDPSSVAKLEAVAADRGLARHVRAVHLRLGYYERRLADIPMLLAEFFERRVKSLAAAGSLPNEEWLWTFERERIAAARSADIDVFRTPRLLNKWWLSERLPPDFAEYRSRYLEQKRATATIFDRIAAAMSKMPQATRLVRDDGPGIADPPSPNDQSPVAPTSWLTYTKDVHNHDRPPVEWPFKLILAVHRAGVKITALHIHRLPLPTDFRLWDQPEDNNGDEPEPPEAELLREACRNLRVFEFTPDYEKRRGRYKDRRYVLWPESYTECEGRLAEVLRWMPSTSASLSHVNINLQAAHGFRFDKFPLTGDHYPNLRVLHLKKGGLDFPSFISLLDGRAPALEEVRLDGMHLCAVMPEWVEGERERRQPRYSWAMLLDKLHHHCKTVRQITVRIRRPEHAEFTEARCRLSASDKLLLDRCFWPFDNSFRPVEPRNESDDEGGDSGGDERCDEGLLDDNIDDVDSNPSYADLYAEGLLKTNPFRIHGKTRPYYGDDEWRFS
ncbi:hypothetical protein VTJ49DRAFT_6016 [Mycothermus thermophilus]|uniref:F-box domain-containing protein n=1 Tax=Humicola insolens TaxID=85995 RepID=A0ABR3VK67_HUMIN